jgi:hypothetical protein
VQSAGATWVEREPFRPHGHGISITSEELQTSYAPVCEGPCTRTFASGEYRFGVSKAGGGVVPLAPVRIVDPSSLRVDYVDRSGLRTAGVVLGLGGLAGGTVMLFAALESKGLVCTDDGLGCYQSRHTNVGLLIGGIAVMVGSLVAGSVLATLPDEGRISVVPLQLGLAGAPRESALASHAPPQGAGLEVRF